MILFQIEIQKVINKNMLKKGNLKAIFFPY